MHDLTVTKVRSNGRYRETNRVHSGDAYFSDGRDFSFSVLPGEAGDIEFFASRKRAHGGYERFSFKSAKRALALAPHLARS